MNDQRGWKEHLVASKEHLVASELLRQARACTPCTPPLHSHPHSHLEEWVYCGYGPDSAPTVCECVCECMCMCVYVFVYAHVFVCVCVRICLCVRMFDCV
jgi:hypothetical protein